METENKLPDDVTIPMGDEKFNTNNDSWFPLFLSTFNMLNSNNSSNVMLEKEVAYLRGKIDILEQLVIKKED